MRRSAGPLVVALLASLAVACGATVAEGPPELRLGVDECSRCRMIVSEPATAAVARGPGGEEARFDDLACLTGFVDERGTDGWQIWVHTLDGDDWLEAERAHYLRDPRRITPMGSGWVALARPPSDPPAGLIAWSQLTGNSKEDRDHETQ